VTKVEGFKDLERVLSELPKSTAKAAARRWLKAAGKPIMEHARSLAPEASGNLKSSYRVGTRLSKAQRKKTRRESEVEVYIGPNDPAAIQTEFGNDHQRAQPHLRPAWDAGKTRALEDLKKKAFGDVLKTVKRYRKRVAKK